MRKFFTNINSTTDLYILCTTFRSKSFVSRYQKNSLGNTSVYQNISGSEKFCASERGEGVSRFYVENFLSHSAENLSRGESFSVSLILGYRKILCFRGLCHDFVSILCRKNSGIEKFQAKEGGSFTVLSKIFLSHRTEKTSPWNHSVFQKLSGREKYIMDKRGYHDFPSKLLSHCTEIFHWRTLWCFRKILLSKIFMHRRGASRFCQNFLSHRTETKSFVKDAFCFPEKFWY